MAPEYIYKPLSGCGPIRSVLEDVHVCCALMHVEVT